MEEDVRVLVVEDDSLIALDMQRMLSASGYTITSISSSGEEAIRRAAQEKPHVILMDIQLTGDMNGLETAKQIHEHDDIPVIYVTTYVNDDILERAKVTDSFGYLLKPFRERDLYSAIEIAMYKHQMEQQLRETNVRLEQEIKQRTKREQELEQYRRHLEQLVEERTQTLEDLNTQLQQASRHKDEFLANMSHELRTPLNAILGYAQILKDERDLSERHLHGLEIIRSSGQHLLTLINEILDLSKIEAGHFELEEDEFPLPSFLEDIANMIKIRVEQKGLSFCYDAAPHLPARIYTDEKRLREILINLLDNAVKYTQEGSVMFRVSARREGVMEDQSHGKEPSPKPSSPLHHSTTPTLLRFEVEDTGIGIAAEQIQDIFAPFHQVGARQQRAIEGTGLGLAITSKLVRLFGGELEVTSTPGAGSTFWFKIQVPAAEAEEPQTLPSFHDVSGYTGKRRTVLVADDNEHNRTMLLQMLFPLGFHVIEAQDGKQCVEKTLSYTPDIILLDLRMPVMDGYDAVKTIRDLIEQNPQLAAHPPFIIAVSASVFEKTRQKAREAGFDDFLNKPFQREQLLTILHASLHFDWKYANRNGEFHERECPSAPDERSLPTENLLLPPEEDIEKLKILASKSRMKPLLQHLAELEERDPRYRQFVHEMRKLTKTYQTDEIVKQIQR